MSKNKSIFLDIYKNKKIKKLTPYISFLLVKKEINKISVKEISKYTYRQTTNNHNECNTDNRNDKKRTP